MALDSDRFSVEAKGDRWAVRDNTPPKGSPFKDGLIYISSYKWKAEEHRDHLNGKDTRR